MNSESVSKILKKKQKQPSSGTTNQEKLLAEALSEK